MNNVIIVLFSIVSAKSQKSSYVTLARESYKKRKNLISGLYLSYPPSISSKDQSMSSEGKLLFYMNRKNSYGESNEKIVKSATTDSGTYKMRFLDFKKNGGNPEDCPVHQLHTMYKSVMGTLFNERD